MFCANSIVFCGIRWSSVVFCGILWCSVVNRRTGLPWRIPTTVSKMILRDNKWFYFQNISWTTLHQQFLNYLLGLLGFSWVFLGFLGSCWVNKRTDRIHPMTNDWKQIFLKASWGRNLFIVILINQAIYQHFLW